MQVRLKLIIFMSILPEQGAKMSELVLFYDLLIINCLRQPLSISHD